MAQGHLGSPLSCSEGVSCVHTTVWLALATVTLLLIPFYQGPGAPACLWETGILGKWQLSQALGLALFASLLWALEELADMPSIPAF